MIPSYGKEKPYIGREDDFQKTAINYIRRYYCPNAYHCPNGGKRNAREASKFKSLGVLPGIPDIIIDRPMNGHHGARIELKVKGGKLSPHQRQRLEEMQANGYAVGVCWGVDGLIEFCKMYFTKSNSNDTD